MTQRTDDKPQAMDRRRFLTVVGVAGGGSAALSGCSTDKVEKLIPYLVQSEDQVPGLPTYYASTCTECATGCGLHVKTREGRAIKLEGNPEHPVNRGTLCARGQAGLQGLYNPGRIKAPAARSGAGFQDLKADEAIKRLAEKVAAAGGKVAVISGAGAGTFSDLLAAWTQAIGGRLVRYEPFDHEALRAANRQVFGTDELPAHDFAAARYILSFGADFLETWLAPIENQRGFAQSHGFNGDVAKFVSFGSRMSLTGLNADQHFQVTPGSEAAIALAMANVILSERSLAPADANGLRPLLAKYTPEFASQESGIPAEAIRTVAREFAAAQPGLAVAGGIGAQHRGAAEVCAAVNLLNYVAGNVGRTVKFGARLDAGDGYAALESLAQAMDRGEVQVLIVHEANPVYALPKAAKFADRMKKVPFKVSTSLFLDETSSLCDLLIPGRHALERWDDARPRAGVHSLMQPVMEPVFPETVPTGDVLLKVAKQVPALAARFTAATYEAHLRDEWGKLLAARGAPGEAGWREALQKGGIFVEPAVAGVALAASAASVGYTKPALDGSGEFVLSAYPTSMYHDGRGANRPWLLENADPVTKITWHSWVEVHPETAARLDVREGEILQLTSPHGSVEAPVYVYAGIHPDVLAVPLGLGHTEFGQFATGRGVNPLDLLGAPGAAGFVPYLSVKVSVAKPRKYKQVAKTEGTPRQLGRGIAEAMPVALAKKGMTPEEAHLAMGGAHHEINTELEKGALKGFSDNQIERTYLGNYTKDLPKWGMAVDLSRCTGCSACVTACYAENNIPWVGEDDVLRGREMTWMRIERYWEGGTDGEPLEARFVPVMCQHCDNAPCEPVCPVYAAYHTPDGLNGQVYNRCVGTRYCANNCPYKVRYYNWLAYNQKAWPEPMQLQLNPEVTVRARGIMEKCTFCVQRIRWAQNDAKLQDRPLRDGDVVTACQQACPSGAISFGNVNDPEAAVVKAIQDHRAYRIFEEINVRPAVRYLAKVSHREPPAKADAHGAEH